MNDLKEDFKADINGIIKIEELLVAQLTWDRGVISPRFMPTPITMAAMTPSEEVTRQICMRTASLSPKELLSSSWAWKRDSPLESLCDPRVAPSRSPTMHSCNAINLTRISWCIQVFGNCLTCCRDTRLSNLCFYHDRLFYLKSQCATSSQSSVLNNLLETVSS